MLGFEQRSFYVLNLLGSKIYAGTFFSSVHSHSILCSGRLYITASLTNQKKHRHS